MKSGKNFLYIINVYYEDKIISVRTNEVNFVCEELLSRAEEKVEFDLIDSFTGEILVDYTDGATYTTPEWSLIIAGYLALRSWG